MLETLTPPVSKLLTTLDTARDEIGDLGTDISDARVLRYIARTSALIVSALSMHPAGTYRDTVLQNGRGEVVLSVTPIRQITSIADAYRVRDITQYSLDSVSGILRPIFSANSADPFDYGYSNAFADAFSYPFANRGLDHRDDRPLLTVTYDGGWTLPGQPGRDLPEDIESVCIDLVVQACADAGRNPAIMQESQDGAGSIRYFDAKKDNYATPPELTDLIARYAPIRF